MAQRNLRVADVASTDVCEPPVLADEDWRGWVPGAPDSPAGAGSVDVKSVDVRPVDVDPVTVEPVDVLGRPTGPVSPQPHVLVPAGGLPLQVQVRPASLWVVGAHGGSGESTLAGLDEHWRPGGHAWPLGPHGDLAACVVVARTNVRGLLAARTALTQWAAGAAGESAHLLGLVLVSDAPGKLPAPLRDLATVVGGGAPRVWNLPWVEAWRLGNPVTDHVPRPVTKLVNVLRSLTAATVASTDHSHHEEQS